MSGAETWNERLTFWGYRALETLAVSVPERAGRTVAVACGELAYRRSGRVRAIVAANQARVLRLQANDDRVRASTREAFALYARYWLDTFRLRAMTPAAINARVQMTDFHHVDAALAGRRGCVIAVPHAGNWDLAGCWLAVNGYRVAAVVEDLKPRRLAELFRRHREALGIHVITLTRDGSVVQRLQQLLADNWIVALVADRDLNGRGVEVDMFGATRRVPAGPALLSVTTDAPLLVGAVQTTARGWRIRAGAPVTIERRGDTRADVAALSQRMAAELERVIAARPPDWHLFQPGWSDEHTTEAP